MSNRQLKRLQQLAVPAQLLDSDEDEEGTTTAAAAPSRFSVTSKASDRKRRQAHPSSLLLESKKSAAAVPCESQSMVSVKTERESATKATPNTEQRGEGAASSAPPQAESETGEAAGAVPTSTERKRKEKKQDQRRKKREKELEEETLLERVASGSEAKSLGAGGAHRDPVSASENVGARGTSALRVADLLTCCDPKQLNTRTERIKCFGIDSVEDVGVSVGSRRNHGGGGGGGGGNPLLPSRPPGFALPQFRHSPFVTPNRYNWPAFASLGVTIQAVASKPSQSVAAATEPHHRHQPPRCKGSVNAAAARRHRTTYQVNWSDAEFQRAQANFERVVESMADVNTFLQQCFTKYPYHIPTLLQLHQTFAVMGDQPNSQMMLDFALYTVGVYLSAFPMGKAVTERCLPISLSSNRLVFETLKQGILLAVKRGCNRTAFQLARFLLSLDENDPCGMLLTWDYYALRAREWELLLQVFSACEGRWQREVDAALSTVGEPDGDERAPSTAAADISPDATSGEEIEDELSSALFALPSFHFNAALAKFLLEEAEQDPSSTRAANTRPTQKPSEEMEPKSGGRGGGSARMMLAKACLRFPGAAWQLVEKNNVDVNTTTDVGWALLRDLRQNAPGAALRVPTHLGNLFVERSHELWKSKEATNFLVRSVSLIGDITLFAPELHFQLRFQRETFATEPLVRRYQTITPEDLCGTRVTPIAAEMLNPAANPDEVLRDAREREDFELRAQGFPQGELDALLRFEAVFGPLPVDIPVDQRLRMYDDMLQEFRAQIGQERNPVALFLETLLPWNNLRDMALDRAMAQRGVEDPVRRRNARQRRRDEDVWRAAEHEAQARDDEASSSDDEGGW